MLDRWIRSASQLVPSPSRGASGAKLRSLPETTECGTEPEISAIASDGIAVEVTASGECAVGESNRSTCTGFAALFFAGPVPRFSETAAPGARRANVERPPSTWVPPTAAVSGDSA